MSDYVPYNVIKEIRRAVYAGSFDPPTAGHLHVINAARRMFDEVIVAIGENPAKKYTFSLEERLAMLRESIDQWDSGWTAEHPGWPKNEKGYKIYGGKVIVTHFTNKFLIDFALQQDCRWLIRGIRNQEDYEHEKTMANFNYDSIYGGNPSIQTVWIPTPKDLSELSSSAVKGMCGPDYWKERVERMVSEPVFKRLVKWERGKRKSQ